MNFKACTFERLALIFGFGRGAQVGKTSLLEVNLCGASVDVERIHFLFGTLQALGSHQNPRYLEEDEAFFLQCEAKIVRRHTSRQRFFFFEFPTLVPSINPMSSPSSHPTLDATSPFLSPTFLNKLKISKNLAIQAQTYSLGKRLAS